MHAMVEETAVPPPPPHAHARVGVHPEMDASKKGCSASKMDIVHPKMDTVHPKMDAGVLTSRGVDELAPTMPAQVLAVSAPIEEMLPFSSRSLRRKMPYSEK